MGSEMCIRDRLEKVIEELCLGLSEDVIANFLDSCSANFRTLEEKWVKFLGIMLTKPSISSERKGLTGKNKKVFSTLL